MVRRKNRATWGKKSKPWPKTASTKQQRGTEVKWNEISQQLSVYAASRRTTNCCCCRSRDTQFRSESFEARTQFKFKNRITIVNNWIIKVVNLTTFVAIATHWKSLKWSQSIENHKLAVNLGCKWSEVKNRSIDEANDSVSVLAKLV